MKLQSFMKKTVEAHQPGVVNLLANLLRFYLGWVEVYQDLLG